MPFPPKREFWRKRVVLTIVVIALTVAGVTVYAAYQLSGCGNTLVGCGPPVYPAIQSAHAYVNSVSDSCQIMTNNAVCSIWINGGDSGNVTMNVHNVNQQNGQGGNRVQFMIYSSEPQYVNFTSIPQCGYTTAPNFNSPSCIISGPTSQNLQPFQFNFIVSPSYGVSSSGGSFRQPASVTIIMYQTCCWP